MGVFRQGGFLQGVIAVTVSHMQIDAIVSEIQPLEHSAIVRACTEIVKSINMH